MLRVVRMEALMLKEGLGLSFPHQYAGCAVMVFSEEQLTSRM